MLHFTSCVTSTPNTELCACVKKVQLNIKTNLHDLVYKLAWLLTRNLEQRFGELTLIRLGGGGGIMAPLNISRDNSATRKALATTLYDNFLSSFPHMLTPNLWRPGLRFRSYVTFCTRMHVGPKKAQNVILCTKSMQIEFFHLSSYKYAYFLVSMAEINLF